MRKIQFFKVCFEKNQVDLVQKMFISEAKSGSYQIQKLNVCAYSFF